MLLANPQMIGALSGIHVKLTDKADLGWSKIKRSKEKRNRCCKSMKAPHKQGVAYKKQDLHKETSYK